MDIRSRSGTEFFSPLGDGALESEVADGGEDGGPGDVFGGGDGGDAGAGASGDGCDERGNEAGDDADGVESEDDGVEEELVGVKAGDVDGEAEEVDADADEDGEAGNRIREAGAEANGVLFANLVSAPNRPLSGFYHTECEALTSVFPRVYSFPTAGGFLPQNIEVVATIDDGLVAPADLRRRNERGDAGIDLSGELNAYRYVSPTDGGQVLRDDDLLARRF